MKKLMLVVFVLATAAARAQSGGQEGLPQRFAPIDLTGTWVSIVTEDWDVRMLIPPKGDVSSLPLTPAAVAAANSIDMTQVAAAGRACEAYGAPVIMREPGRVRISWESGDTLRIETDSGQQMRLLHFDGDSRQEGQPSLQGHSVAEWQYAGGFSPERAAAADAAPAGRAGGARGRGAPGGGPPPAGGGGRVGGGGRGRGGRGGFVATAPMGGRLKALTTNLQSGFLRKNGVPYSANTTVTEYYNLITEPTGQQWMIVTTVVHDPANLVVDWVTSTNFRKEPNDSGWQPKPCTVR